MKLRRVNLFAGPGAGKSVISAWLFSQLKMRGIEVEQISEYVKAWAWIGRPPRSWDQVYIFGKQLHKEDIVLRDGGIMTVTDSPLFMAACYAKKYGAPGCRYLSEVVREFDETYPALNILIDRAGMPYNGRGRFQNQAAAEEMDALIRSEMDAHGMKYSVSKYDDLQGILGLVEKEISE
jgi:hypothetical protein